MNIHLPTKCKSITANAVEQIVKADLLAVMLFANEGSMVKPKGFRWSKKTRQLAPAA
jgi:hypothetical protein